VGGRQLAGALSGRLLAALTLPERDLPPVVVKAGPRLRGFSGEGVTCRSCILFSRIDEEDQAKMRIFSKCGRGEAGSGRRRLAVRNLLLAGGIWVLRPSDLIGTFV
jgi:hypothetical protein